MRIVLLPGLDGTGDLFREFVRCRPASFEPQVVSYPSDQPLDYAGHVAYVQPLLPIDEPYILLGESFSGPVAISTAYLQPAGLKGIVLCNTFACSPAWSIFRFLPWRLAFSFPIPRYKIALYLVGFKKSRDWIKPIRDANRRVNPTVHARRMREVLTVDVRSSLAALTIPVLYLRGTKDRLVWGKSLRQVLETKPDVSVARISAPHLTLQLEPQKSWQAISDFVDKRVIHPAA